MDKNLRKMTVTTETGKNVADTKVLSGQASKTKAESASNETSQYETSGKSNSKGPLGGMNTGS